jgi:glycine/D-amino acid oxidase-like deaminating enzyme
VSTPFPLAPSLWAATAPPAPPTPQLTEDARADVAIVGGGYCGLAAALTLAEAGTRICVLEAQEPGWGASGRNGGQVIPGLKYDPDELVRMFPGAAGERLVRFAGATADAVFDLIARHRMDVPHVRAGWVQGAHDASGMTLARARATQWERHGVATTLLDRDAVTRALGTDTYVGGWRDPRGGAVQPLAFVRGLARAALAAGAVIHGGTRVTGLERADGRWHLRTEAGPRIMAERVLLAGGSYTDALWPGITRSIVALNSFQVATAPLPEAIRARVLPGGEVCSDTRRLLFYFRLDHEGRLLLGGRGPLREPRGAADWAHLERALTRLFPQVAGQPIAFRWCGRVGITRDFLPHLHELAPGVLADIGCMGRGVGLQTALGQALGRHLLGMPDALPFAPTALRTIPLHGLRRLYLAATIAWYRMRDAGLA